MEYKDTILPNEEEMRTLKNGYILAQKNSLDDLNEIYKKMLEEREYLLSQKLSTRHPKMLESLEQCIANMGAILEASDKEKRGQKNSQNPFRPKTASSEDLARDNPAPQSEEEKGEEYSSDENLAENPNQNNEQSENESGEERPPQPQQSKLQNRGRPFRQNPLAKIFSNFPLNFDKIRNRNSNAVSQNHQPPIPPCNTPNCKPPFAPFPPSPMPPHYEPNDCDPHKKMITKELDIIRLILLYMALRPNCPYTYRLCNIAQDHLEILGEMVTTES